MTLTFSSLEKNEAQFFDILPQDWQEIIVPQWEYFKKSASIYVFIEKEVIIAVELCLKTDIQTALILKKRTNIYIPKTTFT